MVLALALGTTARANSDSGASHRFIKIIPLPSGQTLVVAEGEFEPRSVGSFSIRLYHPSATDLDRTSFLVNGFIGEREGSLERVILERDKAGALSRIIVQVRSAGSGGYLSGAAYGLAQGRLVFLAQVQGLPPTADLPRALGR
ncbi:MAG: PliI family lysozyme inhibitor of I-type lysozyme [Desulfovibrionales bacterium]|nr:PliI family lysozyme inhibitor of I-type lysozyme [Desulfovibrionales bacterium]